ncbi:hypothetical protein ACS0TY_015162 [Phlomoides rotata]
MPDSTSSSSSKLVYFVVIPLILLSALVILLNQKPSSSYSLPSFHDPVKSHSGVAIPPPAGKQTSEAAPLPATPVTAPVMETEDSMKSGRFRKKHSNLDNLEMVEASLAQARANIQEAQRENETSYDPDFVPEGPLYRNANTFHRSYLEMEKQFKIYVYEDGDPPLFHYSKSLGILGIEGILIHQIEISKFRTRDPRKAHVYFIPLSVQSIASYAYVIHNRAWTPLQNIAKDYVELISKRYPYWNRTLGHDHFILGCHDWVSFHVLLVSIRLSNITKLLVSVSCPFFPIQVCSCSYYIDLFEDCECCTLLDFSCFTTFLSLPEIPAISQTPTISHGVQHLYKNSIRVLCNANTSEGFKPSVDVSMPEIYLPHGTMDGLIGGPPPSERTVLVFYAGGIHGYIRQVLMEKWKGKDPDVQIHEYLPKGMSYYGMFRKSKYCICPSGWEVASPRMVEAIYMGCVPVLLKDHYAKPFDDVLDWSTFAVDVGANEIGDLKKILKGIPDGRYLEMQRTGIQVRRHFEVNFPPKRYDVFHMILHSIWLRRMNIQLHDTHQS